VSLRRLLFVGLLGVTTACGSRSPTAPYISSDPISIPGRVQFFNLEGGFWAIRGDDGVVYDPKDPLPVQYRVENLRVTIVARVRTDLGGIHMVGPIVEIVGILALSGVSWPAGSDPYLEPWALSPEPFQREPEMYRA
jgi:hypothetical protein